MSSLVHEPKGRQRPACMPRIEDDVEDEHDGKDLDDGRERLDERRDDELHARVALEQAERAEDTQDAQRLEAAKGGDQIGEQARGSRSSRSQSRGCSSRT